jgi:hypothetical protein
MLQVCAQAGDLILWDSRTVHCNTPALTVPAFLALSPAERVAEAAAATQLIRVVSYVCMLPTAHATPDVLQNRLELFRHRIATSHWPNKKGMHSPSSKEPRDLSQCPIEQLELVVGRAAAAQIGR